MNAKRLNELMQLSEEINKYGSLESRLLPGTVEKIKGSRVTSIKPLDAKDRERIDRLMSTHYGLPSNPNNVPTRFF